MSFSTKFVLFDRFVEKDMTALVTDWSKLDRESNYSTSSTKFVFLFFSGWFLIAYDIFDSSFAPLNGYWRNLTGSKYSTPSTNIVFFVRPIRHLRWQIVLMHGLGPLGLLFNLIWQKGNTQQPLRCFLFLGSIRPQVWSSWHLIDWHIFDLSSPNDALISSKLERKRVFNDLYQIHVFRVQQRRSPWFLCRLRSIAIHRGSLCPASVCLSVGVSVR